MENKSFFVSQDAPYYIYAYGYSQKSGGIRALYSLCHALNVSGYEAYIVGVDKPIYHLRAPLLSKGDFLRHQKSTRAPIVIYPEVVDGNPLELPHVVRWLLNNPGVVGGPDSFSETDYIVPYSEDYMPEGEDLDVLTVPVEDMSIFHNEDNPFDDAREGTCYYANKYLAKGGELTDHVNDSKSLCQNVELTRQELADILRRSELLYSYETSALISEARLCGCPVVMIPEEYSKENYTFHLSSNGLAQSTDPDAIAEAKKSLPLFKKDVEDYIENGWLTVERFAKQSQQTFLQREQQLNLQGWGQKLEEQLSVSQGAIELDINELRRQKNEHWLKGNTLSEARAAHMAERMMTVWHSQPTFHCLIAVNATEFNLLSDTLESLERQLYQSWGLTILSYEPMPDVFADAPENIEWVQVDIDINEAIDTCISEAGLDWLVYLSPGDKLEPHALLTFAESINFNPNSQLIYCDEIVDEKEHDILFKPAFNHELLYSQSYLGTAIAVSRVAFEALEGFTSFAFVQNTDMAFKVIEHYGEDAIGHIPQVLWTSHPHKVDRTLKKFNEIAIRKGHLSRLELEFDDVINMGHDTFQITYPLADEPMVSIVIAVKNHPSYLSETLESLHQITKYDNYEIILVDQCSDLEDMPYLFEYVQGILGEKLKQFRFEESNYAAAINFGVSKAQGEYIVVVSPALTTVNQDWLTHLVSHNARPDIAVVGLKLVNISNEVEHAGTLLGLCDDFAGVFKGEPLTDHGYMKRLISMQEYPAVSGLCFMTSKYDFDAVAGFDENELADTKHLVEDYCLKQWARGKKVIWSPYATMCYHPEVGFTDTDPLGNDYREGADVENHVLQRWQYQYQQGFAFNANLSLTDKRLMPESSMVADVNPLIKSKLRVMVYPFDNQGVGHYRVRSPLYTLAKEGHIEIIEMPNYHHKFVKTYLPSLFELNRWQPDVIYTHQMLTDEHYDFMNMVKTYTNIRIMLGIDDLVSNLTSKSALRRGFAKDMRSRLRRSLSVCDRFVVSTQPLLDIYHDFHSDIQVVPNSLQDDLWLTVEKKMVPRDSGKPRVGWVGGCSHDGDLAYMIDVVKETADEVDWVFMGMCPDEIRDDIKEFHEGVALNLYPQKVAELDLDLAVAPLEPHPFNECKSNLRLLEYGIMGWPVICSKLAPYIENNPPVTYADVEDKAQWVDAIRKAIADPEALKAKGNALNEWVKQNYLLSNNLHKWLSVLEP